MIKKQEVIKLQKPIRLALIGAGMFVKHMHIPNILKLQEYYKIHCISDLMIDNAKEVSVLDDQDVDMVLIGTRHDSHAKLTVEAARKGKAVFVEKPIGLTHNEVDEVIDTIKETKVPYLVGHNRRYAPFIKKAKDIIRDRKNPAIINYRVNAGYLPPEHWAVNFKIGGGRIIGEGCHMIDVTNYLLDSKVEKYFVESITPALGKYSNMDNFTVTMKYMDGSIGTLTYTALGHGKMPKEYIEIFSEGKSIMINDYKQFILFDDLKEETEFDQILKGHYDQILDFARFVLGEKNLDVTLDDMETAARISIDIDANLRK